MEIVSRKDAIKQELKRYLTSKPCKHGHIAERLVSNRQCVVCYKDYYHANSDKINAQRRAYYRVNSDKINAQKRAYYHANKKK